MKFYPNDWRGEACLRVCSLAARGLWMEMLAVMHEATPRGSLMMNGKPMTSRQLAALVGTSVESVEALIEELRDAGVFSEDESGAIYSRRMRRDDRKALEDKANGAKGGNPTLKGGVNPNENRGDKAQKPEARDQKQDPSLPISQSHPQGEGGEDLFEGFWNEFPKDPAASPVTAREAFEGLNEADQRAICANAARIAEHIRRQNPSRPHNPATFLRDRKFEGLIVAPKAASAESLVFVAAGTPQWLAWEAEYRRTKNKSPPLDKDGKGWRFPTEWPPGKGEGEAA